MPDANSRYKDAKKVTIRDHRGRERTILVPPQAPSLLVRGEHLRVQGQRLDHLAAFYLGDGTAFWKIAEANDAMLPESLSEADVLIIPFNS
ncbi:MAG TPA: hypothetical protein ENJ18_03555 [Nannocystis exedens]|nr:hypothetical protein [Nannocystis exedens]